jgi:hypothetical protein
MEDIKWSTKHYADYAFHFHDFIVRMMHYITPRLQISVKTLPFNQWDKVGQILEVAFQRYQYLQQVKHGTYKGGNKKEPRRVQILVMGGSVTAGVFCKDNPVIKISMKRTSCAWPHRLKDFLNALFRGSAQGADTFEVYTAAFGGTNTRGGTMIWEYNVLPDDFSNPDIVINAFSTNDMHVLSIEDAKKRNITLEDALLTMNQEFIRKVLKPQTNCYDRSPPLLLYLDDYLGNEQREILQLFSINTVLQKLSTYYGFGFMSYADAVKDLVYRNPSEEHWFSPSGWPERQIHHGTGGHIGIMWVVVYNMLNIVTNYCDRLDIEQDHVYMPVGGLPPLREPEKHIPGEPGPRPLHALPPELNANLTLSNIGSMWWHEAENEMYASFNATMCLSSTVENGDGKMKARSDCYFQMFWKVVGKSMSEVMAPFVIENDGWIESNDEKNGLVPQHANASLKMQFVNVTDKIQTLNFIAMKSYGEKWDGSKVRVEMFIDRKGYDQQTTGVTRSLEPLRTLDIEGFHSKKTSESYDYKVDLGDERVLVGDTLRVSIKLIGGNTSKIMGMLFCRF